MENTYQALFGEDDSEWYLGVGDQWVGPMSATDVFDEIQRGAITWGHPVWKTGMKNWSRIVDVSPFKEAAPALPSSKVLAEIQKRTVVRASTRKRSEVQAPPPPPGLEEERTWYLYYNQSQFGPYSDTEIVRALKLGKINGGVFIWKEGMTGWERLSEVPHWKTVLEREGMRSKPSQKELREQRKTPRLPLVAHILFADGDQVIRGVCRDISVGGMQVLTDRFPGDVGHRIRLNVSPSSDTLTEKEAPAPFVAEGVIVRILEDGRGFSFRFDRLPEESRRIIEEYIRSQDT